MAKRPWTPDLIRKRWRPSADCDCKDCRSDCRHRPGVFLPDEIRPQADFFGLGLPELYKRYLVLDYFHREGAPYEDAVWMLAPGNYEERGQVASVGYGLGRTGVACVFLTMEGRCSIQAVKPWECRWSHHARRGCKGAIAKLWDSEEGRALIREVGADPALLRPSIPTLADVLFAEMVAG